MLRDGLKSKMFGPSLELNASVLAPNALELKKLLGTYFLLDFQTKDLNTWRQ